MIAGVWVKEPDVRHADDGLSANGENAGDLADHSPGVADMLKHLGAAHARKAFAVEPGLLGATNVIGFAFLGGVEG